MEEVDGEKALTWARETSAATTADLENVPEFESIHTRNLETYDSEERIPYPDRRGRFVYNFWKDAENERGYSLSEWAGLGWPWTATSPTRPRGRR